MEVTLFPNVGLPATDPADASDDNRDSDGGGVPDYVELTTGGNINDRSDDSPTGLDPTAQPSAGEWIFIPIVGR